QSPSQVPMSNSTGISQIPSNDVKVGMYAVISGNPCEIMEISLSDSIVHLEGIDIFTRTKYVEDFPSDGTISVPDVVRTEFKLLNIEEGRCILMADDGFVREDLEYKGDENLKEKLMSEIAKETEIKAVVLYSMGNEILYFPGYQKI
ncbi:hypothetical protein BGZ76_007283, partial [Entomortierella beljakovae]